MVSPHGRTFTDVDVIELTWGLLTRLRIVGFALQSPDETDWTAVATSLDGNRGSHDGRKSGFGTVLRRTPDGMTHWGL